jgi:hypothetical protein
MAKERHKKTQQISVAFPETAPVNRTLSDTFKINNSCILKVNSAVYANHVVQATSRDYINPIKIKFFNPLTRDPYYTQELNISRFVIAFFVTILKEEM